MEQRPHRAHPTPASPAEPENAPGRPGRQESSAQPSDPRHYSLDNAEVEDHQDQMLIDGLIREMDSDVRVPKGHRQQPKYVLQKQNTASIPNIGEMFETSPILVSPLKHKQSNVHDGRTNSENLPQSQKPATQRPQEPRAGAANVRVFQQLAATSAKKQSPFRARTESLEVAQELMMVSVQKRPRETKYDSDSSDEEGNSDRESVGSYSESEIEDEEASEDDGELTPADDSEQDRKDEGEAGSQQSEEEDMATDDTGRDNGPRVLVRYSYQASSGSADAAVRPQVSTVAEAQQHLPLPSRENEGIRDERISDESRTTEQIAILALQALEAGGSADPGILPHGEACLPDICRSGIKNKDIFTSSGSSKPNKSNTVQLGQAGDSESSWCPRIPETSGLAMEVDEIVDSPTPAPQQSRQIVHRRTSRRSPDFGSQQLTMVRSRWNSPIPENESATVSDTQGSVELGAPRKILRRLISDEVPETQRERQQEIPETQLSFVPQLSFMERALGQLNEPMPKTNLSRTKPMQAHVFFAQQERDNVMMVAGGITMIEAFQHTVSPIKSGRRLPTLLEESSGQEQILKALTRQASLNLGTLPINAQNRTSSLRFKPPFLRSPL